MATTRCFACGGVTGSSPRRNRLPDGRWCPSCDLRLLDALPPLLPARPRMSAAELAPDGGFEVEVNLEQVEPEPWDRPGFEGEGPLPGA